MAAHIDAGDLAALVALAGDDDDLDRLGAHEERQRVGDGARRRAAAVPAHQNAVELDALLVDIGYHDDRATRSEQGALYQEFLRRPLFTLGLPDHGNVEAPRDPPEQIGAAADAGIEHARFGRNPGGRGRGPEPADR